MFDIGFTELFLVAVVGLVVIGPERLPTVARTVGRTVGKAKRFMRDVQWQLESEVRGDKRHDPSVTSDEVEPPMRASGSDRRDRDEG